MNIWSEHKSKQQKKMLFQKKRNSCSVISVVLTACTSLACYHPLTLFLSSPFQTLSEQAGSGANASKELCALLPFKTGHVECRIKLGRLWSGLWLKAIVNVLFKVCTLYITFKNNNDGIRTME